MKSTLPRYHDLVNGAEIIYGLVTMQAQKEAPPDMQCKDKFLLQSAVISGENTGVTAKDITPEMVISHWLLLNHLNWIWPSRHKFNQL